MNRIRKMNFLAEYSWFEFRVFLLRSARAILPIAWRWGGKDGFMPFLRSETPTASPRIWTRLIEFISWYDNRYVTFTSFPYLYQLQLMASIGGQAATDLLSERRLSATHQQKKKTLVVRMCQTLLLNSNWWLSLESSDKKYPQYSSTFPSIAYNCIYLYKPSASAGCNTRSIFKRSLIGLNSEFSFSLTGCYTKVNGLILPNYSPLVKGRRDGFIPFPRVLVL